MLSRRDFSRILIAGGLTGWLAQPLLAGEKSPPKKRRVIYNFDGDSCLFTRKGGKGPVALTREDLLNLVEEVAYEGSQVDTILICINAQVMYYPTKVGTMRGGASTPEERSKWPPSEKQRYENMERFFSSGIDPYAVVLAEAKRRGKEALLTFRVNDDHGNDFLRTRFHEEHPECRLSKGALDFGRKETREYVLALIAEAVGRYDCDGLELDFNRFPKFFNAGTTEENVAAMNDLVSRVRKVLDEAGKKRGRRLTLAARVPSNFGRTPPDYENSKKLGCDPAAWAREDWIDFLVVSEFLFQRYDLPIAPWKKVVEGIPIYGGIECTEGGNKEQYLTAEKYRKAARHLLKDGADGIYLFNFFTTREYGPESWEPPFEVFRDLADAGS